MTDLRKAAEQVLKNYDQAPFTVQMDFFGQEDFEALRQALAQPDSSCNGMPAYEGPLSKSQALAQPEQEPVGWMCSDELVRKGYIRISNSRDETWNIPLYPAPPKREWVGLTDEEIDVAVKSCNTVDTYKYFRAIEAKLKEKNGG